MHNKLRHVNYQVPGWNRHICST